jgi:probable F420-dependent oxidoreductase
MTTVGLCLPQLGSHVGGPTVRRFCEKAEELGYGGLWVQEHLFFPREPRSGYAGIPGRPIPPQYASVLAATELMAAAAAWTTQISIGSSILVGGYHRPVQLAQRLATIDVLSDGRLLIGLGVGWSDEEHEQAGTDPRVRGRRMDELVAALKTCWGEDPVRHDGEHFSIPPADVRPKPLQRPYPSLLSGMWSPAGLARTVRDFDGWNPAGLPVERVAEMVATMNAQRRAEQGPLAVYHRSFLQPPGGPPLGIDAVLDEVGRATEQGFDQVIVDASFWDEITSPDAWAELPERLAPLLEATA